MFSIESTKVAEYLMGSGVHRARFIRNGMGHTCSSVVGNSEYLRLEYHVDRSSIAKKVNAVL
jgi:hypothetical protein